MGLFNTSNSWGTVARIFHWLIAFLIIVAIILGWTAELREVSPAKVSLFVYHKSVGITVLFLVILRLGWKLVNTTPAPASGISPLNHKLATLGHWALYTLMFALPITGLIINSAANFPLKWFYLVPVPAITAPDKALQEQFSIIHLALFWTLAAMLCGHIGMALLHHYRHKNEVLRRMLPERPGKTVLYSSMVIALVTLVIIMARPTPPAPPVNAPTPTVPAGPVTQETAPAASAPIWQVQGDMSLLGFTGTYTGAGFDGEFRKYTAVIHFDPAALETSLFEVEINTASVTTHSADRDAMLADPEWFDFENHPIATYVARSFVHEGDNRYIANGVLDLKGRRNDVPFTFRWEEAVADNRQIWLVGEATVNRHDFGIGEGMWADDSSIGADVQVNVTLVLVKDPDP